MGALGHIRDQHGLSARTRQSVRRRPVVSVVAKHELGPAPLDHMPRAGVKRRLELIEASGRGGPVTIAIPGKPAPAAQPRAQPVQGSQHDQDDRQAGDRHEEHDSHTWLTRRAASAFRADVLVPQAMRGEVWKCLVIVSGWPCVISGHRRRGRWSGWPDSNRRPPAPKLNLVHRRGGLEESCRSAELGLCLQRAFRTSLDSSSLGSPLRLPTTKIRISIGLEQPHLPTAARIGRRLPLERNGRY